MKNDNDFFQSHDIGILSFGLLFIAALWCVDYIINNKTLDTLFGVICFVCIVIFFKLFGHLVENDVIFFISMPVAILLASSFMAFWGWIIYHIGKSSYGIAMEEYDLKEDEPK